MLGQGSLCWKPSGYFFSPVTLCVILRRIWDVRGISLPNRQEYFTMPLESLFSRVRSLSISGWWWFGSWVRDLPRFADRRDSNRTETLRFYVWRERIWGGVPRRRWGKLECSELFLQQTEVMLDIPVCVHLSSSAAPGILWNSTILLCIHRIAFLHFLTHTKRTVAKVDHFASILLFFSLFPFHEDLLTWICALLGTP